MVKGLKCAHELSSSFWILPGFLRESELIRYHFHAEGAVVDGLVLDVDVHQRTGVGTAVTRAKGGRHERLITHVCRGSPTRLWTRAAQPSEPPLPLPGRGDKELLICSSRVGVGG